MVKKHQTLTPGLGLPFSSHKTVGAKVKNFTEKGSAAP